MLDLLGLPITEAGCAHVTVESARRYEGGQARVHVVVQAAYSGKLLVDLTVAGPEGTLATRQVALDHGEVRRVRLPVALPVATSQLTLTVKAPIPAGATRVRPEWLPRGTAAEGESIGGALWGALKQAVGAGKRTSDRQAAPLRIIEVPVAQADGAPPIAAEEEAAWQVGMPPPTPARLAPDVGVVPAAAPAVVDPTRPTCSHCGSRFWAEEIRQQNRCPGCGTQWTL